MKRRMELDYTLNAGWLSPWVDALRVGRALASRCSLCDTAQFPPLRRCPTCRHPSDGWTQLSGRATVHFRTTGTDGDFALVQFEGAVSRTTLRCEELPMDAEAGVLRPCGDAPPVLQLTAEPEA